MAEFLVQGSYRAERTSRRSLHLSEARGYCDLHRPNSEQWACAIRLCRMLIRRCIEVLQTALYSVGMQHDGQAVVAVVAKTPGLPPAYHEVVP